MRIVIYILILLLIVILIYNYAKSSYEKVSFKFRFISLQFTLQNLIQLLAQGSTQTRVRLGAKIINDNSFPLVFSNFQAKLFYDNTLVAQTLENSVNLAKITVPAKSEFEVIDDVTVFVTQEAINFLKNIISKKRTVVTYWVSVKIYGVTKVFQDSVAWDV